MILVDLFCPNQHCPDCDKVQVDVFVDNNLPNPKCLLCDTEMKRYISRMSFELKYDNRKDICDWNGNTSNYWKQIKEDRAAGKKVGEPTNSKQPKWL